MFTLIKMQFELRSRLLKKNIQRNIVTKMCTKSPEPTKDSKRVDYLSWSEYFMLVAKAAAMRSKDPATQVGCVIVNINNVIVGTGYNGFPVGCSDDELPWSKGHSDPLQNKHTYVVHAELNAIMNKIGDNLQGCTLYTTLFPCNECAKIIIQARIAKVVFESDREDWPFRAAKKLFDAVNPPIVYEKYCPAERQITITL